MFDKNKIIKEKLDTISNPTIFELGVNRGRSTNFFFNYIETNGGNLYSIDIKDCSNVLNSKKWKFLQSNDLDKKKILQEFPELKKGIDLLFIDSYHDPLHVRSLLFKWYYFVNKKGLIFLMIQKVIFTELKKTIFYQL